MTSGPKGETTVVEPTPAERTVARRAAESRATVPHLELTISRRRSDELTAAALIKACAEALAEHPRVNGAYRDGHFELYSRINIGVVLALPEAYLVPTVFDADVKSMEALRAEVEEMRSGASGGGLTSAAFSGATFTVWNASELALDQASLPVVPPQAGLLVAGSSALTLACDHRILYGAVAAQFLDTVSRRLEAEAG